MIGQIKKWEVWYAKFKFEDSDEVKERPVLITGIGQAYILSIKITTAEPRKGCWGEYPLKHWREAGLHFQSTIRLSKRLRLQYSDLIHRIGRLHPSDIIGIQNVLGNTF